MVKRLVLAPYGDDYFVLNPGGLLKKKTFSIPVFLPDGRTRAGTFLRLSDGTQFVVEIPGNYFGGLIYWDDNLYAKNYHLESKYFVLPPPEFGREAPLW